MSRQADVVFLHGSTDGAGNYDRVLEELRNAGVDAIAPSLTPAHPEWHAEQYADYISSEQCERATAIVANSAAGLLLPAVARVLDARHMVWVASYVPRPGVSLADEIDEHSKQMFNPEWIELGDPTGDPVAGAYFLFHDCDYATLRWALADMKLFLPHAAYDADFPRHGMPDLPSTYVVCALDRTIRPSWQRDVAANLLDAHVVELDSGHCPHVSHPSELAAIIRRVIRG